MGERTALSSIRGPDDPAWLGQPQSAREWLEKWKFVSERVPGLAIGSVVGAEWKDSRPGFVIGAFVNGEMVGWSTLDRVDGAEEYLEILSKRVDQRLQNQGIGTELSRAAQTLAKDSGLEGTYGWVPGVFELVQVRPGVYKVKDLPLNEFRSRGIDRAGGMNALRAAFGAGGILLMKPDLSLNGMGGDVHVKPEGSEIGVSFRRRGDGKVPEGMVAVCNVGEMRQLVTRVVEAT